ncbi:UNVERIFIED_CONTAM: 2',5'-phosphodiesterase 12 [Gekko kuhli]
MGWVEMPGGTERVFMPSNAHIGLRLKLVCTPANELQRYGLAHEVERQPRGGQPGCLYLRCAASLHQETLSPLIRSITYNILADIYAQTELSQIVLYPYCALYSLELDYQQNLLKKELAGYSADIICLQEVDKSVFTDSLGPSLDAFGLKGLFRLKEKQHEGLATFYRTDKLSLLSQHDIALNQALLEDPLHKELRDQLAPILKCRKSTLTFLPLTSEEVFVFRNEGFILEAS